MKKRIMALLLALCMVLSICVPIAVADDEQPEEKAVVPECSCWFSGSPLSQHSPLFGICDRQNFCKEEINTTVSHMVYNWADYPDDVKTYLVELLTGDEAYAEKYAELQKELKLEDNRPQITVEDKSPTVGGYTPSVSVSGQTIRMDKYAKVMLSAAADTAWQICTDTTSDIWQWADITGAQGSLTVSYGLIGSLLTEKNGEHQAYLRAYRTYEDGEAQLRAYSKIYTVIMDLSEPDLSESQALPNPAFEELTRSDAAAPQTSADAPALTEESAPAVTGEEPAPAATETDSAAAGANAVLPASLTEADETGADGEAEPAAEPKFLQPVPAFPQADGETPVQKNYDIIINYLFENNEIVAAPYTASIGEGTAFNAQVDFPVAPGYLPYIGEEQVDSYTFAIESASENITINVVYKPTNVDYTIIFYQQNIDNDNYKEVERVTLQGLNGSKVPKVEKTYDGFYQLLYERPNIAANGSTVIEVYYDREYYLMNFALEGGYGVEPVYARYGTPVEVGTPTKPGYTFEGWNPALLENPTTMPAGGITYTAVWKVNETAKVSIVIWGENADDEDYSYIKDSSRVVEMKPGTEFTYSENGTLICALTEHQHNASCYVCGHAGTHTRTLACYGLENAAAVDPNNGYGDNDARTHFEDQCDNTNWLGSYTCRGLKQYLKDGSVCRYNDNGDEDFYFLYWGGKYYEITANQYNNWKTNSGRNVTHGRDTYYVYTGKTNVCAHTHTDTCANCGIQEHTHDSNCYLSGAGMDKNLWNFVRSDTVTVAPDGSTVVNVYYDRVAYDVRFYGNRNSEYTQLRITAKWGADISAKWPTYNGSSMWATSPNGNTYQVYLQLMPVGGGKFYGPKTGNHSESAYYYVEVLPGETGDTTWNGVRYKLHHKDTSPGSGYKVSKEDQYDITGYTYQGGTNVGDYYNNAKFYYSRNSHTLMFNNGYEDIKTESVKFEAPLGGYDFTPELPTELYEAGSRHFAGWYLNPQCTGAEYKLSEHQMKDDDLILYAKWEKNTYTVRTWLTEDGIGVDAVNVGGTIGETNIQTVEHGDYAKQPVPNPTRDPYKFVGWFYKDANGEEHAFDFADIPVKQNLDLYAKWSSNVLIYYTVIYKIKGTDTEIAERLESSGLAGMTKTFEAKGGNDLDEDYREGYFPTAKSQSLALKVEEPNPVLVFEYVAAPSVPYTVRYLDQETGERLIEDKIVEGNKKAVVTETFVPIKGYLPDAYQKRLVVTAEGDNILIFYYKKDDQHAYYKITHYIQGTDGQTWMEYTSSQVIGDIDKSYRAEPTTISGFTFDKDVDGTVQEGILTLDGLELKLYYTRNKYAYEVRYLEKNTGRTLHEPKTGTDYWGKVISESAVDLSNEGYTPEKTSDTLIIRIEAQLNLNVITFYYEQNITISYEIVGPTGCGSLTCTNEKIGAVTGTSKGSAPTANAGFKFVGWFKDEACTQPVDAGWVENNKLTPQKTKDYGGGVMGYEAATYYAKFEYDVFDLKIIKTGAAAIDENQSFVFRVEGEGVSLDVVVHGNGSVTVKGLKVGTYTVTEESAWSWRYTPADTTKTVTSEEAQQAAANQKPHEVTAANTRTSEKWLNGSACRDNRWIAAIN